MKVSDSSARPLSPASDAAPPPPRADRDDVSLLTLLNVVLRRRAWVYGTVALLVVSVVGYSVLRPRTYSSTASFMPQSSNRLPSNVSGLAAQFGLAVPMSDADQSPEFYASLIESREILGGTVDAAYTVMTDTGQAVGNLITLFEVRGDTPEIRRDKAIRELAERVATSFTSRTSVVRVTVTATDPGLAQEISGQLLERVNRFNMGQRRTQAAEERRFAERRLAEARASLRSTENRLQDFLQRNRAYEGSPSLRFEQDRLAREVSMQQEIYTTLSQAYEQARIDEVRDTPVITVIEPPNRPARPDPRGLLVRLFVAIVAGAVLGIVGALVREFLASPTRHEPEEYAEFAVLRHAALDDLTHPWRPVRRFFGGRRRG